MDGSSIAVIAVALIGAIGSILSNIVIGNSQTREFNAKLDKQQAVMKEKIENLTMEVQKHNGFAEKIPELKFKLESLEQRLSKLENNK